MSLPFWITSMTNRLKIRNNDAFTPRVAARAQNLLIHTVMDQNNEIIYRQSGDDPETPFEIMVDTVREEFQWSENVWWWSYHVKLI